MSQQELPFEEFRDWTPDQDRNGDDLDGFWRQFIKDNLPEPPRFPFTNGYCAYCGISEIGRKFVDEHIIAQANDGPDVAANKCRACWDCNARKSDRDRAEFVMDEMRRNIRSLVSVEHSRQEESNKIRAFATQMEVFLASDDMGPHVLELIEKYPRPFRLSTSERKLIASRLTAIISATRYVDAPAWIRHFLPGRFIPEHELPDWFIDAVVRAAVCDQLCTRTNFESGDNAKLASFWIMRYLIGDKNPLKNYWFPLWMISQDNYSDKSPVNMPVEQLIRLATNGLIILDFEHVDGWLGGEINDSARKVRGDYIFRPGLDDDRGAWKFRICPEWIRYRPTWLRDERFLRQTLQGSYFECHPKY